MSVKPAMSVEVELTEKALREIREMEKGIPREFKVTYEDYLLLPDYPDRQYELIDGRLLMVPAPRPYHQEILLNLSRRLADFVETRNWGHIFIAPCDVVLSEVDVVQPDILLISAGRAGIITEKNIQGAPDLVVEIISPSREHWDRIIKRQLYARYSIPEYWLVDPERKTVEVMRLGEEGYEMVETYGAEDVLRSPTLEGLEIKFAEIFT
ncbi:MAG: Uma2 family endonuclease [Anaerolineae bacterium]